MLTPTAMAIRSAAVRARHPTSRVLVDSPLAPTLTHAADAVPSAPSRDRRGVFDA
jgi:hypothetical protein